MSLAFERLGAMKLLNNHKGGGGGGRRAAANGGGGGGGVGNSHLAASYPTLKVFLLVAAVSILFSVPR